MPFQKGHKFGGRTKDKPFTDALRMELAAAGDNHRVLRAIARNLIARAGMAETPFHDPLPAIRELADRLDGKPVQQVDTTVTHLADELRDDDLAAIAAGSGTDSIAAETDPQKLN